MRGGRCRRLWHRSQVLVEQLSLWQAAASLLLHFSAHLWFSQSIGKQQGYLCVASSIDQCVVSVCTSSPRACAGWCTACCWTLSRSRSYLRARLPPHFNRSWAQHLAKESQHQTTGTRHTRSGGGWAFCAFAFGRAEFKQIVLNSTWLNLSLALLNRIYPIFPSNLSGRPCGPAPVRVCRAGQHDPVCGQGGAAAEAPQRRLRRAGATQ